MQACATPAATSAASNPSTRFGEVASHRVSTNAAPYSRVLSRYSRVRAASAVPASAHNWLASNAQSATQSARGAKEERMRAASALADPDHRFTACTPETMAHMASASRPTAQGRLLPSGNGAQTSSAAKPHNDACPDGRTDDRAG